MPTYFRTYRGQVTHHCVVEGLFITVHVILMNISSEFLENIKDIFTGLSQ